MTRSSITLRLQTRLAASRWGAVLLSRERARNDTTMLLQVPMIAARITQEEKDSTRATVDEDRKHAIEGARDLVRSPNVALRVCLDFRSS